MPRYFGNKHNFIILLFIILEDFDRKFSSWVQWQFVYGRLLFGIPVNGSYINRFSQVERMLPWFPEKWKSCFYWLMDKFYWSSSDPNSITSCIKDTSITVEYFGKNIRYLIQYCMIYFIVLIIAYWTPNRFMSFCSYKVVFKKGWLKKNRTYIDYSLMG